MAERLDVSAKTLESLVYVLIATASCSRPSGAPSSVEAGADAASATLLSAPSSSVPAPPLDERVPAPAGEARRSTLAHLGDDPKLAPFVVRLEQHFGAEAGDGFVVQSIEAAWGRTALLVSRVAANDDDADPLVLLLDHGEIVWLRDHPIAGIVRPVRELTIAAHPSGGTVLVAFVPSVSLVAARVWDEDGYPFAELSLFPVDACDALSVTYAPGAGWLVAAARQGGARAQWLREDGTLAWGTNGLEVGGPWRAPSAITALFDTSATVMLFERGSERGSRKAASAARTAVDHVFASRYDESGKSLWTSPFDLGAVPNVSNPAERVDATLVRPGVARVGEIDLDSAGPHAPTPPHKGRQERLSGGRK